MVWLLGLLSIEFIDLAGYLKSIQSLALERLYNLGTSINQFQIHE